MAVLCFWLVKGRPLVIHILGWIVAAYFVLRYAHGIVISLRDVAAGTWREAITAFINLVLLTWTVMYAFGGRRARRERLQELKGGAV